MSSVKDIVIHIPGRNGNGYEYILQTMLMNSFNTKLAVCIDMTQFTTYQFEFGNLFNENSYNVNTTCFLFFKS